jgi:undecaprenyl pyrophosphate phosphatase UppP
MARTPTMPAAHDLAIGFLTSLVSGVFAIRFLLRTVGRGRFEWFGVYCVAAGAAMWAVFTR